MRYPNTLLTGRRPTIERRTKTVRPPKLYDLTTLQRDANRLFGLTAGTTLRCAQALYESKLITYPRTDSRYLTDDMGQTASDVLKACFQTFPFLSQTEAASTPAETSASAIPSVQGADSPNIGRLPDSRKVSDSRSIKADCLSIFSPPFNSLLHSGPTCTCL